MDAIEDLRTSMARNGGRLIAARRVRRDAMRARTQSIERIRLASAARQRSLNIGRDLDATVFRSHTLVDEPRPR